MFNRIKVVTGLVLILIIFAVLQISSGGVFYHSLNKDQRYFDLYQNIRKQQTSLSASWVALMETRNSLNRAGVRFLLDANKTGSGPTVAELLTQAQSTLNRSEQAFAAFAAMPAAPGQDIATLKSLKQQYELLHGALAALNASLNSGDITALNAGETQNLQDAFEEDYNRFLAGNIRLYNDAVEDSDRAYNQALDVLATVLIAVLLVCLLVWVGIRRILLHPLNYLIKHIRGIAEGDLTRELWVAGRNEMGKLAESLRDMQSSLAGTVQSVRQSATTIYRGATDIVAGNNDLSARTEQQASALEQTAASMEQLTATVKQNAENARQAKQLALNASETAQKGGKVVDNVVKTMHEIAGSSQKIADITGVIDGIAFQTNILALNAAVEAARAGEQGRGFAVVAGEVRSLAQRSAQAAKEIKGLIDDSVNRVEVGSTLVESAGETMAEIVNSVTRVTDIMGEIASASDEQSRGIDQVGEAVSDMDRATQQNAALVQQSAAAAAVLETQAGLLNQAVSVFSLADGAPAPAIEQREASAAAPVRIAEKTPVKTPAKSLEATSQENWETF
ncbi:methyl-accepting chemotaxis protein [Acerihabitans sp. KWT182]|uniref:Methyl-accepting chemotaxis protein n=1 Tax=Acerihabitans sp. KWT182 TaxID=3157919 RepID=A0AAU7Q5R9_9GAMM